MTETTIRADSDVMTLVNVFTVSPSRQQELVDVLVDATEKVMADIPGFISANIHRSDDGTRDIARFDPIVCEVAYSHHA
jgi:antibiotic biosynthesis monooxygenase (ABM) superfamily enzyme